MPLNYALKNSENDISCYVFYHKNSFKIYGPTLNEKFNINLINI